MKKLTVVILILTFALKMMAQQDSKLTQNMFLVPLVNPGAMGQSDKICAAAAFRNQWMGLPGAPTLASFTAHAPVSFLGRTHGVGINFMSDQIAFNNDFYFSLAYSYKTSIGAGELGIGVNAGLANFNLSPEWNGADVIQTSTDPFIPQNGGAGFAFDIGLGAYYSTDNLYVGISSTHLNEGKFTYREDQDGADYTLNRHFYLVGGYNIQLPNPMFELMPSFMIQTDLTANHIMLNTNLRYNKRFWGGVSYTVGGGFSPLFGVELQNGLKVGVSYDVELSRLFTYNSGSLEITVRYCFDLSLDKNPSKYESIRFL